MCNAWNHSDDCACGFGPPYPNGKVTLGQSREWYQSLPTDANSFGGWLLGLGLESGDIEEGRSLYRRSLSESGYPAEYEGYATMAPGAQSNIIEWLQRMIGAYTYKTLNTRETKIDMPLFTLRSPRVKGSRVAYEDREENGKPKGWNITVFGAGLGASRELRAEYGMKFYCTGGGCKQIYIPELPVSVIVNEVYKGGAFVREQVTVEVGGLEKERYFEKGIRSCPKHQASDEQSSADKIERFTLTGGVAGETTTYTRRWASSESRDIALEVGVGVLKATVNATIRAEQEIRLTYDLPEGHEYEVRYLAKECGIAWAVKPES